MEPTLKAAQCLCLLISFSLACCPLLHAAPCPAGQLKTADTLVEIEHAWASALQQRDTAALGCILGEEFQDADPEGAIFDRAATLSKTANHGPVHHDLQDLSAHVYGDFGYIRGLAIAANAQGKIVARVRFTDIYVYRDQRWQAVAAHESMLPATP
jgi:predicted GNAT superfamily acetyltransferase